MMTGALLTGCASLPGAVPVSRTLPPEGNVVLGPVAEPPRKPDARVALAEARSALREANRRLRASRMIYRGVRKSYGAKD